MERMSLMNKVIMSASNISVRFGGLWAVKDVNMEVETNQVHGVMGPNGAGKSTFLNVLSGLQQPSNGYLKISNQKIVKGKPWKMTELGLSRSFQTVRLLPEMSVLENVLVGGHLYASKNPLNILLRTKKYRNTEKVLTEKACDLLRMMGIEAKADQKITGLSLQERRRVEIARSLMTEPRILLLDEPCAGLNPHETDKIAQMILTIKSRGISVILVEHNVRMILSISDKILVLDHGRKIAEGSPTDITKDEGVIKAYLGGAAHA
ncbi:ABC transporter ATP-binding protein [Sporolactobacillus sp. THM7-7]|nr:ABC transporter ATP-binding protein [Sporolactobacillus sp. THM7-7]